MRSIPPTPIYRGLIAEAIKSEDDGVIAEVEEIMRGANGGVLDHLDRGRFRREARLALAVRTMLGGPDRAKETT